MNKLISIFAIAFALVVMTSCGGGSRTHTENGELINTTSTAINDTKRTNSIVGTYSITGPLDREALIVTINEDKTVQMKYESSDYIFYGNWDSLAGADNSAWCHFKNDNYTTPTRSYDDFDATRRMWTFVIMDGYCYADYDAAKSKNPRQRNEAKKIDGASMSKSRQSEEQVEVACEPAAAP